MASGLRTPTSNLVNGVGQHYHDSEIFARLSRDENSNAIVARRGNTLVHEGELRERTDAWRAAMNALPNDAIALMHTDGVEFVAAMMGAWYASKIVYLPGDSRRITCQSLAQNNVAFVGEFASEWNPVASPIAGNASAHFPEINSDTAQLVIYTSGSTGAPQALPKRLTQLLAEVDALENIFGERLGRCEILSTVSHQHIYGLLFKILLPLVTHRTFISASVAYPEEMVRQLTERDTAVVSGPAHLKRLPPNIDWAAARTHARAIFSSGGPLPLDAAQSVEQLLGVAPIEVYGSSETGGVAWRQRPRGVDQPWTPLPGVLVKQNNSDGCLSVQSRHLADTQWQTVADRVAFDSDGRFTLLGRVDRIAKIEGKRISLVAIEDALMQSELVAEARVVVLETGRDELGAIVVPSDAGWSVMRAEHPDTLRTRLQHVVAQTTERIAHPRRWRWLDALPANAVGKTTNDDLVALFTLRALAQPATHQLERSETRAKYELYVSPHLACFDGHFESMPVLPGIAQIDWAVTIGVPLFRIQHQFERLEAVKFQCVYRPGPLLSLELEWRRERGMLLFQYTSSEGTHSSGRIFFTR